MNSKELVSARMMLHFIQARTPPLFPGLLALLLLLTLPLPLRAQEQGPAFRFEVRLVQIEVRVTQNGRPLKDLQREDFVLKEDGEIQNISRIEYIAGPEPLKKTDQTFSTTPDSADSKSAQPTANRDSLTWIYILPEVQNAVEFRRLAPAIREFLTEQVQPGFLVSLGGLPFTNKQDLLRATLDRLVDGPYGDTQLKGTVDPAHAHLDDLQFQRQIASAMQQESDLLASPGFTKERGNISVENVAMFSVEKVDRQISFFGRMALFRYLDLIEKLAVYPGKKIIVLFRSGFRLDPDNTELMQQLASASIRHRVSLYVGDSRGLAASTPVDDRKSALGWSYRRRRRGYDLFKDQQLQLESKDGLVVLARETGGKVIIDSNDMGEVLDAVTEDASDYYVLGYYPSNLEENGRFRKLEIKVTRPDVKVEVPRGYYERKPIDDLSGGEKEIYLRQVMNRDTPVDFPLSADYSLFAEEGGDPVVVFSVGAMLGDVTAKKSGKHAEINTTIMMRFSDRMLQRLPLYLEQKLDHRMELLQWEASRGDVKSLLAYSSQLPLSPGLYNWKIVVLDDNSGRLGSDEVEVAVPDFSQPSTAGTLLLTRELAEVSSVDEDAADTPPAGNPILEAGGFVYLPQPAAVFRQGDSIHILFHLYNPTEADEAVASQGMQIGILRNGQPVTNVEAYGTPYLDRQKGVIRYTASVNTATLETGDYTLMAVLPNYQTRRIPHLEKKFTVLPAPSAAQ